MLTSTTRMALNSSLQQAHATFLYRQRRYSSSLFHVFPDSWESNECQVTIIYHTSSSVLTVDFSPVNMLHFVRCQAILSIFCPLISGKFHRQYSVAICGWSGLYVNDYHCHRGKGDTIYYWKRRDLKFCLLRLYPIGTHTSWEVHKLCILPHPTRSSPAHSGHSSSYYFLDSILQSYNNIVCDHTRLSLW